jgi:copper transport protein
MSTLRGKGALGALVMVAIAFLMLALATPAQAHDELVKATPADGTTMKRLPAQAVLVFGEEASARDLTVKSGDQVLPVQHTMQPRTFRVDLRSVKPAPTVLLTWRMIDTHDGHESSGVLRLHVRGVESAAPAPVTEDAAAPPAQPRAIGWLAAASRVVGYLAMAAFVGGLLFVALLWPAGAQERRTLVVLGAAVAMGILGAVGSLVVVLWRAAGSLTLSDALTEDFGRVDAAMTLLWILAAVVVVAVIQGGEAVVQGLAWRVGALFVAAGLIRTTGMNAHATQTADPTWGIAADFLHLTAVSAWVGGLTVLSLCLLPRKRLEELELVVPKFSKVAATSVLMILASGLILLWQIIASVDGFWATHYSRVLIVKLSLFALVLLAAMKSKHWVEKRLATAVDSRRRTATRSFAVSVAAETVLVITVLGAAGVLVTSSPGV